ncbi:MAG TPA: hypothetical protein VEW69_03925 [Alphaproteobacteria bacterium]|nr:hypothetical protein [Alphaproteobacteria bacterium]
MLTNLLPSPMNCRRVSLALALAAGMATAVCAQSPQPPVADVLMRITPAPDLIRDVVFNELADRAQQLQWKYTVAKRVGQQTLTEEQIDTKDGPIYRVLAIDGAPLDQNQRKSDDERIDRLIRDPAQQQKLKKAHDDDEKKLEKLMGVMPDAFIFEYDGAEGNLVRIKFRPNPSYNPPTYETRVAHSLAGTILIDAQQKRLARLSGQIITRVEFGFGFFGHIDEGGIMEVGRTQVGPAVWKTSFINIQLSGRLVFFKTINKQEYETRSDFQAVSSDISLLEARQMLPAKMF